MDLRVSSPDAFREARAYWSDFVSKCISRRLDTDRFELYVPLVHVKYPLPASVVADVFLRTQPYNTSSLDPRVPPYVQVLFRLGYVDVPSVLNALYKYSSSQVQLRAQEHGGCEGGEETKDSAGQPKKQAQPWINSYWAEEVMFYHAIKRVVEGSAFRDSHSVLEMLLVMSRWMQLFTAASNAFATDMLGQMQDSQARHEMEMSRAAFLPLLLRLPDQVDILKAVRKPYAKGESGSARSSPPIPQLTWLSMMLISGFVKMSGSSFLKASLTSCPPCSSLRSLWRSSSVSAPKP